MKPQVITGIVIVVIVIAVAGWFAFTNPSLASALGIRHPEPTSVATSTPMGRGTRGGFVSGSIEVLSDNGFTVTLQNGTTKPVTLTATTTLQNYATASSSPTTITADQLSVGEPVFVTGTPDADGSIDARRVTTGVMPAMGARGGFGGHGGHASTTPTGNGGPGRDMNGTPVSP